LVKIPDFGHYLVRWIEFRLINTEKYIFPFLAAGFCPKNNGFARVRAPRLVCLGYDSGSSKRGVAHLEGLSLTIHYKYKHSTGTL